MLDIKHTEDGDIDLSSGDIVYADSEWQHKADILIVSKGEYKESPAIGVGAIDYLHDENPGRFLRTVREELYRDGVKSADVYFDTTGELIMDGDYEN